MKGSEYLNNRKSELDSSGRIAEVVSNDEIAIALVYEANSKVSQRIGELEKELKVKNTELAAKDARIAEAEHHVYVLNNQVIRKCEEVHDLYAKLDAVSEVLKEKLYVQHAVHAQVDVGLGVPFYWAAGVDELFARLRSIVEAK